MSRTLPLLLLAGALAVTAGCTKKQSTESSGSLLSGSSSGTEEEEEADRGMDGDVTNGGGQQTPRNPDRRIPR